MFTKVFFAGRYYPTLFFPPTAGIVPPSPTAYRVATLTGQQGNSVTTTGN